MPNLMPPIITVKQAVEYRSKLQAIEPNVEFLMSLYLHESMTVETIVEAKRAGITGVKSYPAGVTTNSSSGVVDYASYYPIFKQMEQEDMVLNLHGECPSKGDVTIWNAESEFLPILATLSQNFPRLRICLEHVTTAEAVETVKNLGKNVVATITAHHLHLIVDDWAGDPINYCKPVAKTFADRTALLNAASSGNPKFFFGSDSAPHSVTSKCNGNKIAAGVFTQPYTTQLVIEALETAVETGMLKEEDVTLEKISGFMSEHGRAFYELKKPNNARIELIKGTEKVMDILESKDGSLQVVPFRRGKTTRTLTWLP
ncbi:MAG: hypothetical protein Q9164_002971 [Protoblastenia rupestris]